MGLQPTPAPTAHLDRIPSMGLFKRKIEDSQEDDHDLEFSPKKLCMDSEDQSVDSLSDNSRNSIESDESESGEESPNEDSDKENSDVSTSGKDTSEFESILAKTLTGSNQSNAADQDVSKLSKANNNNVANSSGNPRVIVEHRPLPNIYELQQNSASADDSMDNDQYDSGLSDDSSSDGGIEDSDEEMPVLSASPLYNSVLRMDKSGHNVANTPPPSPMLNAAKPIYQDRFWSQSTGSTGQPPAVPMTPPPPAANVTLNATFQFLEQNNQRIECAENGKSYMQLGTMSHHLPVTPVIQPKPSGMGYPRRPIPPFRTATPPPHGHMVPQPVRPVCDHSNCLQKKQSNCYKNQRSRMLNVSLHKLHMARQNHEGSLRRSVLICNMLRHIEDETEKDAIQESQYHHQQQQQQQHLHQQQQQSQQQHGESNSNSMEIDQQQQYWNSTNTNNSHSMQQQQVVHSQQPAATTTNPKQLPHKVSKFPLTQ